MALKILDIHTKLVNSGYFWERTVQGDIKLY